MDTIDRAKTKKDIILALIPTTAYASLQPSAKNQLLDIADMFVDYIYAEEKKAPAKPVPSKKSKKETIAPATSTE